MLSKYCVYLEACAKFMLKHIGCCLMQFLLPCNQMLCNAQHVSECEWCNACMWWILMIIDLGAIMVVWLSIFILYHAYEITK